MGILALDIDGTVTGRDHAMPEEVEQFLSGLQAKGWRVCFITGRTFSFGYEVVQACTFPYLFAVYNGAMLLRMPGREVVVAHEVERARLAQIVKAANAEGLDPFIHAGVVQGDRAYFRPKKFDAETLAYLEERRQRSAEPWVGVDSFKELELDHFMYGKIFGCREALQRVAARLKGFATTTIQDPLRPTHAVLLVTDAAATKGGVVRDLRAMHGEGLPVIAAGDDYNDMSMLEEADVAVAMATAPREVRTLGDVVAPPSSERGIIQGLQEAMEQL